MSGSERNSILLSVTADAGIYTVARWNIGRTPGASTVAAVRDTHWSAVIAGADNVHILYDHGADLPPGAVRALGDDVGNIHEVLIPRGSIHRICLQYGRVKYL
jgi:hypothetical protein